MNHSRTKNIAVTYLRPEINKLQLKHSTQMVKIPLLNKQDIGVHIFSQKREGKEISLQLML